MHAKSTWTPGSERWTATLLASVLTALIALGSPVPAWAGKPAKAVCGNGIAEGAEQCDTSDLRSQTCQSLGFTAGTLLCAAQCTLNTAGCTNARFVDNGDGTVTDNTTGLQWELKNDEDGVPNYLNPHDVDNEYTWGNLPGCSYEGCPNGTAFTNFLAILNWCSSGNGNDLSYGGFAGHCDWRLPTVGEIDAILTTCLPDQPCTDPILWPAPHFNTWSSVSSDPESDRAWTRVFYTGGKFYIDKTFAAHVRAVRNAR